MRKMKRFVSAVIMAAMVGTLCLTGCGSDKSAEGSTGSKSGKQHRNTDLHKRPQYTRGLR